ncbi:MAG: cell division topological specificity factor MinE [Clostridia bacterium]|nr:cell division topological specificity factor MinE [Clostridia bacterium]
MDNSSMQNYCENRLKKMLIKDKQDSPQKVTGVLKSEILYVLKNYMEVKDYDIDVDITISDNGYYKLIIQADCRNLKTVSYIS